MLDDLLEKKESHIQDIPIAPILDMMVSIIFFLLLSTTYFSLTYQSVPPSQSVTITDPLEPPPRAPKLLVYAHGNGVKMSLNWVGNEPGTVRASLTVGDVTKFDEAFVRQVQVLVSKFNSKYPDEKAIQVGFGSEVNYQLMVSTLEAVTPMIKDVALLSYKETDALSSAAMQ